jgi:hypothetical protein
MLCPAKFLGAIQPSIPDTRGQSVVVDTATVFVDAIKMEPESRPRATSAAVKLQRPAWGSRVQSLSTRRRHGRLSEHCHPRLQLQTPQSGRLCTNSTDVRSGREPSANPAGIAKKSIAKQKRRSTGDWVPVPNQSLVQQPPKQETASVKRGVEKTTSSIFQERRRPRFKNDRTTRPAKSRATPAHATAE